MSGLRDYRQSVPKYIKGEPPGHLQAKQVLKEILERHNYDVTFEAPIVVPWHKGIKNVAFPVDVLAVSRTLPDTEKVAILTTPIEYEVLAQLEGPADDPHLRIYVEATRPDFFFDVKKGEVIVAQVDGEYHRASAIQKGRTQNRDDSLGLYCERHGIRYIVFNHPNVIQDIIDRKNGYKVYEIEEILGLTVA